MCAKYIYQSDSPEYSNIILNYKIHPCQNSSDQPNHDKNLCFYYHSNQEQRRIPIDLNTFEIAYQPQPCTDIDCQMQQYCKLTHNNYELKFHPLLYKTQFCKNFSQCSKANRLLCPDLHENEQPRNIKLVISCEGQKAVSAHIEEGRNFYLIQSQPLLQLQNDRHEQQVCLSDDLNLKKNIIQQQYQQNEIEGKAPNQIQLQFEKLSLNSDPENISLFNKQLAPKGFELITFKTCPCPITASHNLKHCIYYHNENDRRRSIDKFNYSQDECPNMKNYKTCPKGDNCEMSHNKVEQLYHQLRYKSKFCQNYPKKIEECEYGEYCSFAHSEQEITIQLIHKKQRDDIFYVWYYKTVWCPYTYNHDRGTCPYAHNVQDFRRNPASYEIEPIECKFWIKNDNVTKYDQGDCPQNLNCKHCHGWKEFEYHPKVYKTKRCTNGKNCKKRDCAYFHTNEDRNKFKDGYLSQKQMQSVNEALLITQQSKTKQTGMPINVFQSQQMTGNFGQQQQEHFAKLHQSYNNSHFISPIIGQHPIIPNIQNISNSMNISNNNNNNNNNSNNSNNTNNIVIINSNNQQIMSNNNSNISNNINSFNYNIHEIRQNSNFKSINQTNHSDNLDETSHRYNVNLSTANSNIIYNQGLSQQFLAEQQMIQQYPVQKPATNIQRGQSDNFESKPEFYGNFDTRSSTTATQGQSRGHSQESPSRDASSDSQHQQFVQSKNTKVLKQKLNLQAIQFNPYQGINDCISDNDQFISAQQNHEMYKTAPVTPDIHKNQNKLDIKQMNDLINQKLISQIGFVSQEPISQQSADTQINYSQSLTGMLLWNQLDYELQQFKIRKISEDVIKNLNEQEILKLDCIKQENKQKLYQILLKMRQEDEDMQLLQDAFQDQQYQLVVENVKDQFQPLVNSSNIDKEKLKMPDSKLFIQKEDLKENEVNQKFSTEKEMQNSQ